ncbi:MAG: glycosyltransferase [Candidatus Aenigmatarchaeota archaeon]
MKSKISALIFSINEYELVKPKVELLYPYVDEIVIIDSSTDKNQKKLMKNLSKKYKKVKVVWLPPIGIADFYYKIGINECKYDWIFQLDADDFPSKKLLRDLRKLINDKYDAYKIYRKYRNKESREFLFRLIKKDVAYPTGLIHWVMASSSKNYIELNPRKYFIESDRRESLGDFFGKSIKYSRVESFQLPTKLLYASKLPKIRIEVHTTDYIKYYRLFSETSKINYLSLLLSYLFYLMMLVFYFLFLRKEKSLLMKYIIYTLYFFIQHPFKNLYISKKIYEKGFYELFELDSKEKILKNARKLNFGNVGIKNFEKLLEYKFKEVYIFEKLMKNFKNRKSKQK